MAKTFGLFQICVCLLINPMAINKANAGNIGTTTKLCEQFLQDKNLISLITAKMYDSAPCSCAEYDMAQDAMFDKQGNCYEEWLFNGGVKQRCCYSKNGKLLKGFPEGGFVILDGMEYSMNAVHDACCHGTNQSNCKTFYDINPSDDCKRYKEQITALSWGDPIIETVGIPAYNYSFNGHGEYVFLKSDKGLEVQARLDYLVQGNNDSTIFTAFAITNYNKSESIQIDFVRSTKTVSLFLNTGTIWKTIDPCQPVHPIPTTGFTLICLRPPYKGFHIIPNLSLNNIALDIFTDGKYMNIKVSSNPALTNMTGLAGNVQDGYFVLQNGSQCEVNASEHDMFDYGESWAIRHNKSLSHFNYNITGGNFSWYNIPSKPRFLEDLLNNFAALFSNCTSINEIEINKTCTNYDDTFTKECLLTIARTCNISLGEAIQNETNNQHEEFMRKSNTPPHFNKTMSNETILLFNGNTSWHINLAALVKDEDLLHLRFEVEPMLHKEMHFEGGIFNWTVGTALRNNDTVRTLRFNVYDKYNMADDLTVRFRYCGCEYSSECAFQSDDDASAECKCPNRFVTGTFCENTKTPCDEYQCVEKDACNKTFVGDGSPCAKCPDGYYEDIVGPKQNCYDRNECNNTSAVKVCEHDCHNLPGSYNCSCHVGYSLNTDKKTCSDIDECLVGNLSCPNTHETCMNLPGNWTCVCEPGYSKDGATSCKAIEGKLYFGYMEYIIHEIEIQLNNDTLQNEITSASANYNSALLTKVANFTSIEIYKIYKSVHAAGTQIHLDFVLHMTVTKDRNQIMSDIKPHLSADVAVSSLKLSSPSTIRILPPNDGGICDVVPKRTDCLEQSTHCVNKEIDDYYDCGCNPGFKKPITGKKRDLYCDDIDECELFNKNSTTAMRCVHGDFCSNTIGSWNCTCPKERLWTSVGTPENPMYRCQGNHSYLGSITLLWDARKEGLNLTVIELFLATQIEYAYKDPSMKSTSSIPIKELFVSVTILGQTSLQRPTFGNTFMLTYEFRIRLGDPIRTSQLQKVADTYFKNGTTVGYAEFQNVTIYNEFDNELCKRSNNGSCDIRTTVCEQVNGTTSCVCKPGYYKHPDDRTACQDINECNSGHTCGFGNCVNTDGNWTCICPSATSVVFVDDYTLNCSAAAFNMCSTTERTFSDFSCTNGDRICVNSTWSCSCHNGYLLKGTGINSICNDDDECLKSPCGNGTCTNAKGSYSCSCSQGFQLSDNKSTCIDIDECNTTSCENGICINYNGSYECRCNNGYYDKYHFKYGTICEDINECTNASYKCDGICTNFDGSFACTCPAGYANDTDSTNLMHYMCKDIDECKHQSGYQCVDGTCININGSWDCVCGVSSRRLKLNNTVIQCIEIYRYPIEFEIRQVLISENGNPTDEDIKYLVLKRLTDILNTSRELGKTVHFEIELLPGGYNHPMNSNITVKVNVLLSAPSNVSAVQNVFKNSFSNVTLRNILTSTGDFLIVSLAKTEIEFNQCDLNTKYCDVNSTTCSFNKKNGHVACDCRPGYDDLVYDTGVGFCAPIAKSKGDFSYVANVSFTIQAYMSTDSPLLKNELNIQITAMYRTMFPFDNIWIEIIDILPEKMSRKKRRTSDLKLNASIKYIVHTNTSKNASVIAEAWTNCTTENTTCNQELNEVSNKTEIPIQFKQKLVILNESAYNICDISSKCDNETSTCNKTTIPNESKCFCNDKLVQNKTRNDTFICFLPDIGPTSNSNVNATSVKPVTTASFSSTTLDAGQSKPATVTTASGETDSPSLVTSETKTDKPQTITDATVKSIPPKDTTTTTKSKDGVDVKKDDKPESSSNTALIATGASLGSLVLILMITIIVVCRLRKKKAQDTERIKLRELEKERKNGFDNSLLGRHYLRSDSKQNSVNDLRETDRDDRRKSYYGGPFMPIEPTYTRPFKAVDPEPIWDRNGHEPGLKGRSGSLPDINGHVDMRMAPETRRMSQPRTSDTLYSSPRKDKDPPPTQKPVDNYRQNMVRVFPESGERLPRAKTNQFPNKPANGRISPKPDYFDDPPRSPKPDYNGKRPRDRFDASHDSGLNGYSRSSGSPAVQRSRESNGYGSLRRGRYRMEDTPF